MEWQPSKILFSQIWRLQIMTFMRVNFFSILLYFYSILKLGAEPSNFFNKIFKLEIWQREPPKTLKFQHFEKTNHHLAKIHPKERHLLTYIFVDMLEEPIAFIW